MDTARIGRARREAMVQRPPHAGHAKYNAVMATYEKRVRGLVERHVIGALPVLGSGDGLDIGALSRGLETLRQDLDALAHSIRRSAGAAFDRTTQHARLEAQRIMGVVIPRDKDADALAREAFIERQVRLLQKMGQAQTEAIRKAIATYPEGTSLRKRIEHQLWVTKNRTVLIAQNELFKLSEDEVDRWAIEGGAEGFIYCTRRDELVRPTHAVHDGHFFLYIDTPKEMHEVNCRCRRLPVTAATLRR